MASKSDIVRYRGRWSTDPQTQRRHRLLRALHELLDSPTYEVQAVVSASGEPTIVIKPKEVITDEAREFGKRYRLDLHQAVQDIQGGQV